MNILGDSLRESLNDLFSALGTALYVTGLGSIMNLHARTDRDRVRMMRELLFFELLERGFYIAPRGLITLSIPVTRKMTRELIDAVREILESKAEAFQPAMP